MVRTMVLIALLMLAAGAASADILEWRDDTGVSHYTNVKDEIPDGERGAAQVVVNERLHPAEPGVAAPVAPAEPRREAQVIYDRGAVSQAYIDGLERGLQAAQRVEGGNVQINGPLAIANAVAP